MEASSPLPPSVPLKMNSGPKAGASIPTKAHFYLNALLIQMCLLSMILLNMRWAFKICMYINKEKKNNKTGHTGECDLNRTILQI